MKTINNRYLASLFFVMLWTIVSHAIAADGTSVDVPINASNVDFDNGGSIRLNTESLEGWSYYGVDLPDYNPPGYPTGTWATWHIWSNGSYTNGESKLEAPFIERWVYSGSTLADGTLMRSIVGVPDGTYILSADVIARQQSGSVSASSSGTYLFMESGEKKERANVYTIFRNNQEYPEKFQVEIEVKDGTVHIGMETEKSKLNWIAIDNIVFRKKIAHTLKLIASPSIAGSFNIKHTELEKDDTIHLYAYANSNFSFKQWQDEDGTVISYAQDFPYAMPNRDVTLTAIYEYNPANPENPRKNYWNPTTGSAIIDDFAAGTLSTALSNAIKGSKATDLKSLIVAGKMTNNDYNVINSYTNCAILDISRVTGITEVPSYAFNYTKLESVYLPATIEKIGYRAFYECKQLTSLTVYALVPPALGSNVFQGVSDSLASLVVYVPAVAIAQYQEANGWKDFTILPIQENIRNVSVSLPKGANVSDYSQMWLELTNTKSEQKIHYVITDRMTYTFGNIINNTSWNIVLRNERGDIFGKIDNIEVKEEDVNVTFTSLSKPQRVSLAVKTPDGDDVTSRSQITWTDAEGNYLAQAQGLNGLISGYAVSYRVVLPQDLAMLYVAPQLSNHVVSEGNNNLSLTLEPIKQITVSSCVKDFATQNALNGATVTASQTFSGKYSKTTHTKTDSKGNYTLTVSNVPTTLTVSASDYISQTVECDAYMTGGESVAIPDFSLKEISGAVISLGLTYTKCPTNEGDEDTFQEWYADYNNIAYSIYNKTQQKVINQFNVQYPQIVLLEDVNEGDVLELTATSKNNAFMSVKTSATIDAEQHANAAFNIVELGKIKSTFTRNSNASVVGSLYDANGKLIKSYDYSNASLTVSNLADGSYTLVTMGSSKLFNTIYDLSQLPQTGLVLGSDYTQTSVEVMSGRVSTIDIAEVPTLNESKLYYTDDNTSFTVNKSSIVVGNYLTLTGRLDFKSAHAANVSNVNLIVDLPETCEFVENSVMVGSGTSNYMIQGSRITIPMARYSDRVRFCIIPTLGGEYAPSALVQFDLDGKTITQPIGSAIYTAKDLSISVPSTVAKTTIPISGTAIGKSTVEIYDNEILVGQTSSNANGYWNIEIELSSSYNLSNHEIFASITTTQGLELKTETKVLQYDRNAVEVAKVTMTNTAHPSGSLNLCQYVSVFDFQNAQSTIPAYWYWPSYPDFTFVVDFTNNDPSVISNVILHVFTTSGAVTNLHPVYDENLGAYVVSEKFHSNSLPETVSVSYDANTGIYGDASRVNDALTSAKVMKNEVEDEEVNILLSQLNLNTESSDSESIVTELYNKLNVNIETYEITNFDEQFEKFENNFSISPTPFSLVEDHLDITSNEGSCLLNVESYEKNKNLINLDDFISTELNDGSIVYIKASNGNYEFIYEKENLYIKLATEEQKSYSARRISGMDALQAFVTAFDNYETTIQGLGKDINQNRLELVAKINKSIAKYNSDLSWVESQLEWMRSNDAAGKYKFTYQSLIRQRREILNALAPLKTALRVIGAIFKAINIWFVYQDAVYAGESLREWIDIIHTIEGIDCPGMDELAQEALGYAKSVGTGYAATLAADVATLSSLKTSLSNGVTAAITLAIGDFATIQGGINKINDIRWKSRIQNKIPVLKCKPEDPEPPKPHEPRVPHVMDPSGFVYEAVFSNRLEGVTATAFYKEMVEDMYGDLHENIVKWDAEEYAQENPLFTDEFGYYRWDVPQGLWQVKFEKEGYETAFSEWLPVPPPQLDVNIAMKQNVQPNVKKARAYENAVEVEFDKYMMPELLNNENIYVMASGKHVEGSIELLNEEVKYEGETETFASKVRFNASKPFEGTEVILVVNNRVKSYAGIRMQDNYSQSFTIEQEIRKIVCDPTTTVQSGDRGVITVSVLPATASAGKTLNVQSSSQMIIGTEVTKVVLDGNGKAVIPFSGELPGAAALTFTIDGYDLSATTIVNVEQSDYIYVVAPKANIASGTTVKKGTKVSLTCPTSGTTIYYTTDGSCPCDEATRLLYTGPITINGNVTIKAIAVANEMSESDVAEFTYIVDTGTNISNATDDYVLKIYPQPVRDKLNVTAGGKIIKSVTLTGMNGSTVTTSTVKPGTHVTLDVSSLTPGIYVLNVTTEDKTFNSKVIKVE